MAHRCTNDHHVASRAHWPQVAARALVALMAGIGNAALADEASVGGIIIATYQRAATRSATGGAHPEGNLQLELHGAAPFADGKWHFEARGGTTPRSHGVSAAYASNATVGETLNGNGKGRLAITQLYYERGAGRGHWRAGLLDPAAELDSGHIATDEYTEFMADAFVHNPTIGFPTFALGASYTAGGARRMGYSFFLGSDSGLEDGPHTYGNVLALHRGRDGARRGAFAAAEFNRAYRGYTLRLGGWFDSGRATVGTGQRGMRYGAYFVGEVDVGSGRLQARAGSAHPRARATAGFMSLAFQQPLRVARRDATLGIALARSRATAHARPSRASNVQLEAYLRLHLGRGFYLTPDVQYLTHADLDQAFGHAVIAGIRAGFEF